MMKSSTFDNLTTLLPGSTNEEISLEEIRIEPDENINETNVVNKKKAKQAVKNAAIEDANLDVEYFQNFLITLIGIIIT